MSNIELRLTGGPEPSEVRDRMIALKDPERRKLAKEAAKDFTRIAWHGGRDRGSKRWRAAALAWVGTATARNLTSEFWRIGWELQKDPELADDVYAVLAARGRHFFQTLARGLLRSDGWWSNWPLVRRAVREGLIEPPEGDDYVRGLVVGVVDISSSPSDVESVYAGLCADPALLEREVWQLFEVDASGELAGAKTWESSRPPAASLRPAWGENRWIYALVRLAEDRQLDRERLLDASLDALMRDFRASSVGWYAALHEALEPTADERRARVDRYLGLVTSSAPAVVKEGLVALKALDDTPAAAFARVAPSVFAHRQKSLPIETLKMLEVLAKQDESARPAVLAAAAHALAHERPDVQERALKLLERFPDNVPRGELLAFVDSVSPTLRARIEALTGVGIETRVAVTFNGEFPAPRVFDPQPADPLERVRDVDELIELAAALLEGHGNGDDAERFLDGVARLCAERPPRFRERTAGLVKQAGGANLWQPAAGDLIRTIVRAWTRGERPTAQRPQATVGGLLTHRALEVASRAARRKPAPLAAFPTHVGGWVDRAAPKPSRLFGRDATHPYDRLGARLRGRSVERLELRRVVDRPDRGPARLRFEAGALPPHLDVRELRESVAELGRNAAMWWAGDAVWLAVDELGARWLLTLVPSLPEIQFARAASVIVDFIDTSVYRHPEVVLEQMLAPTTPLRDPAWDALAAALLAKSPDLQRLAVDVLVATVEDERFDAEKLGIALARLLDAGVGSATRLRQSFYDGGRVSPLHAAQIVRAVGETIARLSTTPHGLHAPLDAAAELSAGCGYRLVGAHREALERLAGTVSPTAKLAKLARALSG